MRGEDGNKMSGKVAAIVSGRTQREHLGITVLSTTGERVLVPICMRDKAGPFWQVVKVEIETNRKEKCPACARTLAMLNDKAQS